MKIRMLAAAGVLVSAAVHLYLWFHVFRHAHVVGPAFMVNAIGGTAGLIEGNAQQVLIQLYGIAATLVWSGGITFVLLKLVGVFAPLRVSQQQELEGLDISQHGEALQ